MPLLVPLSPGEEHHIWKQELTNDSVKIQLLEMQTYSLCNLANAK